MQKKKCYFCRNSGKPGLCNNLNGNFQQKVHIVMYWSLSQYMWQPPTLLPRRVSQSLINIGQMYQLLIDDLFNFGDPCFSPYDPSSNRFAKVCSWYQSKLLRSLYFPGEKSWGAVGLMEEKGAPKALGLRDIIPPKKATAVFLNLESGEFNLRAQRFSPYNCKRKPDSLWGVA